MVHHPDSLTKVWSGNLAISKLGMGIILNVIWFLSYLILYDVILSKVSEVSVSVNLHAIIYINDMY